MGFKWVFGKCKILQVFTTTGILHWYITGIQYIFSAYYNNTTTIEQNKLKQLIRLLLSIISTNFIFPTNLSNKLDAYKQKMLKKGET